MQNPSRSRSVIACPSHGQGGPAEPVTSVAGSAAGGSVALLRQGRHCDRESALMEGQRADPETAARDRHGCSGLKLAGHHRQVGHQQGSLLVCEPSSAPGNRIDAHRVPRRERPADPGRGISPGLSCGLIHSRPRPFTDGHPARVHARRERWRTSVNAGQHCWKACWVQALASSNLASSATLTSGDAGHRHRWPLPVFPLVSVLVSIPGDGAGMNMPWRPV
jgi:hypothetical protein